MQSVYAEVDSSTLTCLDDFIIQLLLNLSHNFLDTCGMYAAVSYQLMESKAANLTADRVES